MRLFIAYLFKLFDVYIFKQLKYKRTKFTDISGLNIIYLYHSVIETLGYDGSCFVLKGKGDYHC